MNTKQQQLCGWSGFVLLALFMTGFWFIAGFVPPTRPLDGAPDVAAAFRDGHDRIRLGMSVYMLGVGFSFPFTAGLAVRLRRVEQRGGGEPLYTYMFLLCSLINIWILLEPCISWTAMALRPERSPDIIQAVNDINWMTLVWPLTPILVQYLAVGVVSLGDRQQERLFPRWVGFYNLWLAILSLPAFLVPFFMSGLFAWSGLFTFWLALSCYGSWVLVMSLVMLRLPGRATALAAQPA